MVSAAAGGRTVQKTILSQTLATWLLYNHKELLAPVCAGLINETMTDELTKEFRAWTETETGKRYLPGGDRYDPKWEGKK